MKEKTASRIRIADMESNVFRALLHFIYTDSLPDMDKGDTAAMCQHLLVAADRYFFRKSGVHPSSISKKRNRTKTSDPAA
jgi:speckle-type POZ protein